MIKNPELKAAVDDIVNCIACGDGGGQFVQLLVGLNHVQSLSDGGDEAAGRLIEQVYRFQRLILALT